MKLLIPDHSQAFALPPSDWTLYHLIQVEPRDSFLWQRFKLMRSPATRPRWNQTRSYALNWSPYELRFARSTEHLKFQGTEPELYARVSVLLETTFDHEWLHGRYDAHEIEAELNRLAALSRDARARRAAAARV